MGSLAIALFVISGSALAGDPCPIDVSFAEFTPDWRDKAADLAALKSKRTWMGLTYGGSEKVTVRTAIPSSPAARSGLQRGDVIRSFGGTPVTSRAHLNELFDKSKGTITLGVVREGVEKTVSITRGAADPVFLGLVNAAESQECRNVRIRALTDAQRASVASGAFDAQRGFRCSDAHTALKGFQNGDVVMIRGGRRILLTMPGFATTCVDVADHDGAKLSKPALVGIVKTITKAYVKDRHDNP